jgi:YegS/Rv2252/BmrU family lipid kinase
MLSFRKGDGEKAMPRIMVIFNPAADQGHARELAPQIKAWLSAYGGTGWAETSRPGEAVELAARACEEGYDIVAAAGGDGTAQEVVNGLIAARGKHGDAGSTTLGLIPIGSGNDFAWMMGVAPGLRRTGDLRLIEEAVKKLYTGKTRVIDVGRICDESNNCRYFDNGVGIGFDGIVNIESRKIKRVRGFLMYTIAVLRTMLWYYRAPRSIIELDDRRIEQPLMMLAAANGRRYGGGFYVTPQAEADDGYLDVCIVDDVSRLEMLKLILLFMKGTQAANPHVQMTRARRVTVHCGEGYAVHADGEIFATSARSLTVGLLPQKLRVIV